MKRNTKIIFIIVLLFLCALASEIIFDRGIPFIYKTRKWAIGIYAGPDPLRLTPPEGVVNPVVSAEDVTDIPAEFVADPFMVKQGGIWYMFFEALNRRSNHGDIGLATSPDGLHWQYQRIILDEPFHLSYPYVFKWQGEFYMLPETHQTKSIRLYKAVEFPGKWSYVATLIKGDDYIDSSIFQLNDQWWIFTTNTRANNLYLYYADNLFGPWQEHHQSPVLSKDKTLARCAGRPITFQGKNYRYAQYNSRKFGYLVQAVEIIELSAKNYQERYASTVLQAESAKWNNYGMHHNDPHQLGPQKWLACVDGCYAFFTFKIPNPFREKYRSK